MLADWHGDLIKIGYFTIFICPVDIFVGVGLRAVAGAVVV